MPKFEKKQREDKHQSMSNPVLRCISYSGLNSYKNNYNEADRLLERGATLPLVYKSYHDFASSKDPKNYKAPKTAWFIHLINSRPDLYIELHKDAKLTLMKDEGGRTLWDHAAKINPFYYTAKLDHTTNRSYLTDKLISIFHLLSRKSAASKSSRAALNRIFGDKPSNKHTALTAALKREMLNEARAFLKAGADPMLCPSPGAHPLTYVYNHIRDKENKLAKAKKEKDTNKISTLVRQIAFLNNFKNTMFEIDAKSKGVTGADFSLKEYEINYLWENPSQYNFTYELKERFPERLEPLRGLEAAIRKKDYSTAKILLQPRVYSLLDFYPIYNPIHLIYKHIHQNNEQLRGLTPTNRKQINTLILENHALNNLKKTIFENDAKLKGVAGDGFSLEEYEKAYLVKNKHIDSYRDALYERHPSLCQPKPGTLATSKDTRSKPMETSKNRVSLWSLFYNQIENEDRTSQETEDPYSGTELTTL